LKTLSPSIIKYPVSFGIWAGLLIQQLKGMNEIAVIGTDFVSESNNILLNFIPNMIIMSAEKGNNRFALLSTKPHSGLTMRYLCKNFTCLPPFTDNVSLIKEIERTNIITG
jgi:uncharacterized protein